MKSNLKPITYDDEIIFNIGDEYYSFKINKLFTIVNIDLYSDEYTIIYENGQYNNFRGRFLKYFLCLNEYINISEETNMRIKLWKNLK